MVGSASGRWRRVGAAAVAMALALGAGGTLLAQSPPPSETMPTPTPSRTSTVLSPPAASPVPQPRTSSNPAPAATSSQVAVVTDPEGLNLREGPGTDYPSLAVIPAGAQLPILGTVVNTNWLPVSYEGKQGFVHDDYVEIRTVTAPSQPGVVTLPGGTPAPTVAPTPTPAPTPPPLPQLAPGSAVTSNGVTLAGVFAYDIDNMITVADEFKLTAAVEPPPGVTKITMRLSGAPFLSASTTFDVQPGTNWLDVPAFKVDTENEPSLREQVVRTVGGTIPLNGGALVLALDFTDASGATQTATFQPTVRKFNDPATMAVVEYPDIKRTTGLPPNGAGADNFYLRGDLDFHHPDDFYVRKLAVEAGRNGGVFPDNPELVADNVFTYINNLLGDAEPGDFNNDYNVARLIEEGTIKRGQKNGEYICIAQTYIMTGLTRTLGMPTRELNILVGRPNWQGDDGVWRVVWWQEGALQTWYNGRWNHYDLWLGFKGMNGYFQANIAYQAWAAYDRQAVMFMTQHGAPTGLRGHDFGPNGLGTFEFVREASKPGYEVLDMPAENGDPISDGNFGVYLAPESGRVPSESADSRGPSAIPWPSPNLGIIGTPERRP